MANKPTLTKGGEGVGDFVSRVNYFGQDCLSKVWKNSTWRTNLVLFRIQMTCNGHWVTRQRFCHHSCVCVSVCPSTFSVSNSNMHYCWDISFQILPISMNIDTLNMCSFYSSAFQRIWFSFGFFIKSALYGGWMQSFFNEIDDLTWSFYWIFVLPTILSWIKLPVPNRKLFVSASSWPFLGHRDHLMHFFYVLTTFKVPYRPEGGEKLKFLLAKPFCLGSNYSVSMRNPFVSTSFWP